MVAKNPECGDLIQGTGGLRKVRLGIRGRGKSGGARIIYFYFGLSYPVFLLSVFAKNEKVDLDAKERKQLVKAALAIKESYYN